MRLQYGLYIVRHKMYSKLLLIYVSHVISKHEILSSYLYHSILNGIWSQYILVAIQLPISSDISFLSHTLNIYIYLVGQPIMNHVNWWDSLLCIRWTFQYHLCSSLGLLILTNFYRKRYFRNCKISHEIITTGFTYRPDQGFLFYVNP